MSLVKIRWSDFPQYAWFPVIVNPESFKVRNVNFNDYVYYDASFVIDGEEKQFELVLPLNILKKEMSKISRKRLPNAGQRIKMEICKIKGKIKIRNFEATDYG